MKYTVNDCVEAWTTLQILSNGDVRPCCWCSGNIGNLNMSTIDEIFNGNIVNELRRYIKEGKIHSMCINSPCKYIQGFEKQ